MKIIRQNSFFFSLLVIATLLYLSQGIILPSDFTWPGINNIKANVLDLMYSDMEVEKVELERNTIDFDSNISGCDFHVYDKSGNIHCSSTYDIHVENIKRYLR